MVKTITPKINYVKGKEKQSMIEPALLQTDKGTVTPQMRELIIKAAKAYGVTPLGITLMSGRPYINETGLNGKWGEDKRKVYEVRQELPKEAIKEDPTAKAITYITMFDQEGFLEALQTLKGRKLSKEILETLKSIYMNTYQGIGYASGNSCKGIGYHYIWDHKTGKKLPDLENPITDIINMTALTRSSNRCKRQIVKVGGTSAEEMGEGKGITLDVDVKAEEVKEKKEENEIEKIGTEGKEKKQGELFDK